MREPQRLTILRASTACKGIALPLTWQELLSTFVTIWNNKERINWEIVGRKPK
jgi:hypothetical protein